MINKIFILAIFFISYGVQNENFISQGDKKVLFGKVVSITDGDTFKLLTQDSTLHRIRLANIDCPERKQPFSKRAKQFASDEIFGKQVVVEKLSTDRNGRIIGNVVYDNGKVLNEELLKNGFAWHYIKYSSSAILQAMEETARAQKIGLWADPNAIAPWEWRSNRKKKVD